MNLVFVLRGGTATGIAGEPGNSHRVWLDPATVLALSKRGEHARRLCSRNSRSKELVVSPDFITVHIINALEARRDGRAVV